MDEKVFLYLRWRVGTQVVAKSKIRELAGMGSLLAQFLRQNLDEGLELPTGGIPVLEYVDANTEQPLIAIRVDPVRRVQVIEGRIPPPYQRRMLDPAAASFSLGRFASSSSEGLPAEQRAELHERIARSRHDLLTRIRETMDAEGSFLIEVPLGT